MSAKIDLTGKTFGLLIVLKYTKTKNTQAVWLCKCKCGQEVEVIAGNLKSGNTTSCGICKKTTHGNTSNRLYKRWNSMKRRGLVCDKWQDCNTFLNDVSSTFKEGYSLGRRDRKKPHSFENSFWTKPRKNTRVLSERVEFERKDNLRNKQHQ